MNESTSVYNIFFCHLIFLGYIILSCAKPMNHFLKKKHNLFFLCTHNVLQRVKQLLPQRKFSGINTIRQSSLYVKTCCGELLAAKLRTFYIVGNWGGCKCLAVQWKCTYTFLKWLYIITSSTQQKCVRSFSLSLFMPCGKMSWNVTSPHDLRRRVFLVRQRFLTCSAQDLCSCSVHW